MTLANMPPAPIGRAGWPWTEESSSLPATRPDGSNWPALTIVTPSFNQGQFIEETIRSVLLQGYPNLEYFVIDGGSTDNSVEIIKKYAPWLTYWHSRKDNGQPDAINFALERASGLWFHNVNSDDVLTVGALAAIGLAPVDADLVAGDVIEFSAASTHLVRNVGLSARSLIVNQYRSNEESWHQPGVILKTKLLRGIGGYSTRLQYLFDHHATCRYLETFGHAHPIDKPIIRFRIHDAQKSTAWGDVYRREAVASRMMLAEELRSPALRSKALRAARRLELLHHVSQFTGLQDRMAHFDAISSILRVEPRLLFDRMFLGSLRRNVRLYLTSMLS